MKSLPIPTLLLLLAFAASARAQDPFDGALPSLPNQPAREVWESRDPRYDTPKQAVHRKAAWKAAQRRQRLESLKRMGYSPSRPPTSPLPFMGSTTRWMFVPSFFPANVVYYSRAVPVGPGAVR